LAKSFITAFTTRLHYKPELTRADMLHTNVHSLIWETFNKIV